MESPQKMSRTAVAADDSRLVARMAAGDGTALKALHDRYGRACYYLASRLLRERVLAQDVVQEAFLSVWRDAYRFDADRGGFAGYLMSVTHHKAVDAVRREDRHRRRWAPAETLDNRASEARGPDDEVWVALQRDRTRRALAVLPDAQREALTLAYFGGYTQREIAGITAAPLGTVKTRMLTGMRNLRVVLAAPIDVGPPVTPARRASVGGRTTAAPRSAGRTPGRKR